jgi:hypothetical protein
MQRFRKIQTVLRNDGQGQGQGQGQAPRRSSQVRVCTINNNGAQSRNLALRRFHILPEDFEDFQRLQRISHESRHDEGSRVTPNRVCPNIALTARPPFFILMLAFLNRALVQLTTVPVATSPVTKPVRRVEGQKFSNA